MKSISQHILEKLKVTKGPNYSFTWNEFINTLYKYEDGAFWLEDLPNIKGYEDLPDFDYEGKIVKVIALVMYDFHVENESVDVLYSPNEASVRKAVTIHTLDELSSIIEPELIEEIYNIISK